LTEVLPRNLPGGTEENRENSVTLDGISAENLIEYFSNKILDLSFLTYNNRPIRTMHVLGDIVRCKNIVQHLFKLNYLLIKSDSILVRMEVIIETISWKRQRVSFSATGHVHFFN
jgi:hypothetical protein